MINVEANHATHLRMDSKPLLIISSTSRRNKPEGVGSFGINCSTNARVVYRRRSGLISALKSIDIIPEKRRPKQLLFFTTRRYANPEDIGIQERRGKHRPS